MILVNENADIQAPVILCPFFARLCLSPLLLRVDKYFSNVAAQVFFHTLDLSNLTLNQLRRRLEDAPVLGMHVRTLLLHPQDDQHVPTANRLDPCIVELLNHMPNIRKLIIYYHQNDYYGHARLLQALSNLPHLDSIETRDALLKTKADAANANYGETTQMAVSKTWWNRLVHHFLDHYPSRLRHVRLYGTHPLHLAAFCKIRDRLPALESLDLTMSIGLDLRDAFAYQTRWKSTSLTRLVLRQCTGVHVTVVANHIASGVFGNLQDLTLTMCGHASDDPDLELPPHNDHSWLIPMMQRVEIDHADHWRVAALARLHVREVVLSRVPRKTELLIVQRERLFPGLQKLSISPPRESEFFDEVRKAAAKRGITVTDDVPFRGDCACHRE